MSEIIAEKQGRPGRKMRLILYILGGLAAVVVLFLIVAAFQPSEYHVSRSATISAPSSVPFAMVNELRKWQEWSPWEGLDPALRRTFEGPPAGVGAIYAWAGNNQVGEGRMTITESRPTALIRMHLEFFKPMAGTSEAEWTFKTEGNQTLVTWSMGGKNGYIGKVMGLIMNMDKMIGSQFETGLARLKAISEQALKKV